MAPVARLMGYTVNGLSDICVNVQSEWFTIGVTKGGERVAARRPNPEWDDEGMCFRGKLEFSVGPNAFQLTENEQQAQRIRRQMADEIVKRIKEQRPNDVQTIVRAAALRTGGSEGEKDQVSEDVGANLSKIISPYAPRDHTSR